MEQSMTESEADISILNSNIFFKEFTFSSNKFKIAGKGEEFELADNVVWLDDILIIIQLKERNKTANSNIEKWFNKKILRTAVKQIKDTIKYFQLCADISIQNARGHVINIGDAKNINPVKLIIYSPNMFINEKIRFQKYHNSKGIGLINLLHIKDYQLICKYLITPFEINKYFDFRELLYLEHENKLNELPEEYILGHYLVTTDLSTINPNYIENLNNLIHNVEEFDVTVIIENFKNLIISDQDNQKYYLIIKEIAKLNRSDLVEFKKRYILAIEQSMKQEFIKPVRMVSLLSKCGFVFFPLEYKYSNNWINVITHVTNAHKYDQKLDKCIGMIVYQNPNEKYIDINWIFIENTWCYDLESIAKNNPLLRPLLKSTSPIYYFK